MAIVVSGSTPAASTTSSQGRDAGEILETFVRECGDHPPDGVLALRWLNDRYRQVWSAVPWNFARQSDELPTVAPIESDSVTVTNGSATVTETTSDNKWTSAVVGRHFRRGTDNEFYEITAYANNNPDTITLADNYIGATGTSAAYSIFQYIYSLNDEVGRLEQVYDLSHNRELIPVNITWINTAFASRLTEGTPQYWAQIGADSNAIQRIALYPVPDDEYLIQYKYVQEAPYITGGAARLVPQVFQSLLKHGWMADYWNWRMAMDDKSGNEINLSQYHEGLFNLELNQMVAREMQNEPPQRIKPAARYIRHRALRSSRFSRHGSDELP
jgi:hypothetical protein